MNSRTAAPASMAATTRQASNRVVVRAAAASSSSPDSSSSSLPLSTRREALALGAASLALGLGSGVVSTPSARAEEGGEKNGCELGEKEKWTRSSIIECSPPIKTTPRTTLNLDNNQKKKKKTEFTILYGTASPPTSYGGYGGNAQETAK